MHCGDEVCSSALSSCDAVFFSNRVIRPNRSNALDQSAVDAPSISAFKQILVKVRNNRMGFFMD